MEISSAQFDTSSYNLTATDGPVLYVQMLCPDCGKPTRYTDDPTADSRDFCQCPPRPVSIPSLWYGQPWICPKCGSVWGPGVRGCEECNPPSRVTVIG
jgi:hypothetical protein